MSKKFELGQVVMTPGAMEMLSKPGTNFMHLLARHATGDWGDLEESDKKENDFSVVHGWTAISFTGDGVVCASNVIRYPEKFVRTTCTGLVLSDGSGTNDNRAVTARGYRWAIEDNDYEVHSNIAPFGQKINDGEGLMHERFHNSIIRGARMIGNRGNRYLCLWADADGLVVRDNVVRSGRWTIHVLSNAADDVEIAGNTLRDGSIGVSIRGEGTSRNVSIRDNTIERGNFVKPWTCGASN